MDLDVHGLDGLSNGFDIPKRKRGRPPKTSLPNAVQPIVKRPSRSELKLSSSFDALSDNGYGTKNIGLVRRSRRYKAPEPSKDMIIILPDDDPAIKLGIPPAEMKEFSLCMDDPIDLDDDEQSAIAQDASEPQSMIVLTPGVTQINTFEELYSDRKPRIPVGSKSNSSSAAAQSKPKEGKYDIDHLNSAANSMMMSDFKGLEKIGSIVPAYNYGTYEADDEDEAFLQSLQSYIQENSSAGSTNTVSLNLQRLEVMISLLEREFECSRHLHPILDESVRLQASADNFIAESSRTLTCINAFIDSLSENGDMVLATETLINAASETEMNSHSSGPPNLRVDPYSFYDDAGLICYPHPPASTTSQYSMTSLPTPSSATVHPGFARKTSEEVFMPPLYSAHQIRQALINSDVMHMLLDALNREEDEGYELAMHQELSENPLAHHVLTKVMDYYINKRSSSRYSLLRCYHDFMMENWHRDGGMIPLAAYDHHADYLAAEESKLLMLRKDLDRARLITDRVRRREKIKREIIRVASESLSNTAITSPAIASSGITSPKRGSKDEDTSNTTEQINFSLEYEAYPITQAPIREQQQLPPTSSGSSHDDGSASVNQENHPTRSRGRPRSSLPLDIASETSMFSSSPAIKRQLSDASVSSSKSLENRESVGSTSNQRRSSSSKPHRSGGNHHHRSHGKGSTPSFSNWSLDEDRLLLLGVAACGLGRWTEIREDFSLEYRSSAQMNQRFFRLTKRRKALVENQSSASASHETGISSMDTSASTELTAATVQSSSGATEEHSNSHLNRHNLSPTLITLLDNFNDDEVWNRISLRYLLDSHQHERRSGRPVKHPVQIPIPSEYKHRGFLKYKHLLSKRPSSPSFHLPSSSASSAGVNGVIETASIRSAATTSSPSPSISCSVSEVSHHSELVGNEDVKPGVRVSPRLSTSSSRYH
jgi:hypothetical protein